MSAVPHYFPTYVFTAGVVALYGWSRFTTPKSSRASTTLFQFYAAGGLYVGACLALYLLLARLIASNPSILQALGVDRGMVEELGGLSAPLLAAVLMTSLLPNVPMLQRVDAWLLQVFRRMGAIPETVRVLSAQIAGARFSIGDRGQFAADLDEKLEFPAILVDELEYDPAAAPSLRRGFTRCVFIMLCLKRWESSRRFGGFFVDFAETHSALTLSYAKLVDGATRLPGIFHPAPAMPAQAAPTMVDATLDAYRRAFKADLDALRRGLCDFMAAALLSCERGNRDVAESLAALGFALPEVRPSLLDVNRVVSIIVCVFGTFLVLGSVIGSYLNHQVPVPRLVGAALLIASVYGCAIVAALLPKQRWAFADIGKVGHRPALAYLVSAALALVAAGAVSLAYNVMLEWDVTVGLAGFRRRYPWLVMSCVASGGLAFLCDNAAFAARHPRWLRWVEAVCGATALMLAGAFVRLWILSLDDVAPAEVPDLRFLLPVDATIGALLAGTIPHWYRTRGAPPKAAAPAVASGPVAALDSIRPA